jgi:hypothetical protein
MLAGAATVDLLQAIESVRPLSRDGPTKARVRILWAAAQNSRHLAAENVVIDAFLRLAVEVGLIDRRGY